MLDLKTLFVCSLVVNLFLTLVLWVYGKTQKTYPGFRVWVACNLVLCVTYWLFSLRGHLPAFLSIVLANSLAVLAAVLRLDGVRRFLGLSRLRVSFVAVPLLTGLALAYLTYAQDDMTARTFLLALVIGPVLFFIAWLLVAHGLPENRLMAWFCASLFFLYGALLWLRAVSWLAVPPTDHLTAPTPVNSVFFLVTILFDIGCSLSFVLMNGQRVTAELRVLYAQLEELASIDAMTGALNHRKFVEVGARDLARAIRYSRPLSLVMFDLDRFKQINDTLGHAAGDYVLAEVGRIARGCLREQDVLGRLGGDEFALCLPETDLSRAMVAVERLQQEVSIPITWEGHRIQVGLSAGVVERGERDARLEELLLRADQRLYEAKHRRPDRVARIVRDGLSQLQVQR